MIQCSKCLIFRPKEEFYWKNRKKGRRSTYCKYCQHEYSSKWYKTHVEEHKLRQKKNPNRFKNQLRKYEIDEVKYEQLKMAQNNTCAICKLPKKLVVDHCHKTNQIRGLLCVTCNMALGGFYDNPSFLLSGINYLEAKTA